ncbi:helix-turn-helix domain-containing protein [Methylophilus flavus]|uniref:Helix-turn-helix domain-containing protein n=1 Tax=Methylophilus flavus TaxID=640084 RepID=A0ABW3PDK8_9PROT
MLKSIRTSQGYKQFEYAKILGCEPSYLSALERGKKDPPKPEKLEKLIQRMNLSENQAQKLRNAAEYRINNIKIPRESNEIVREMFVLLNKKSSSITNYQAKLIRQVLSGEQEVSGM